MPAIHQPPRRTFQSSTNERHKPPEHRNTEETPREFYVSSIDSRPVDTRQDRLPDGKQRRRHHLPQSRPPLQPGRASVPFTRIKAGRSHRAADGKYHRVHGDLLGSAAQRALLHRHQPLSYRGRDRLHRQGLRRAGRHHLAEMHRIDRAAAQRRARHAAFFHHRRDAGRLQVMGRRAGNAARNTDRRRIRRLRHALFVGHHGTAERHQAPADRAVHPGAQSAAQAVVRDHVRHE